MLTLHYCRAGEPACGPYRQVLPYLLLNGLPDVFTGTSTYALLPFYTPEAAKSIVEQNEVAANFDLDKPSGLPVVSVFTQEGGKKVFGDRETFHVLYPADFILGDGDQKKRDERSKTLAKAFFENRFKEHVAKFSERTLRALLRRAR